MDIVSIYEDLAEFEEERGENQPRDRFLMLAADTALAHGDDDRAEEIRNRLLQLNPHHLVKPYPSFADALKSPDVFSYVNDLRHSYPPEEAARLLESVRGGGPGAGSALPHPAVDEPAAEAPAEREEPPIYPLTRSAEPQSPAVPPEPVVLPPKPARVPRPPLEPAPEVSETDVYPLPRRTPPVPRRAETRSPVSDWVSSFLFAILLVAALGLATYTLARPFFAP
jgi:hypothetical protein